MSRPGINTLRELRSAMERDRIDADATIAATQARRARLDAKIAAIDRLIVEHEEEARREARLARMERIIGGGK